MTTRRWLGLDNSPANIDYLWASSTVTMVSFSIVAGGYDVFIATYLFNAATSSLTLVAKYPSGPDPSWISLHPTNKSIL
jgi:hypothetical protein